MGERDDATTSAGQSQRLRHALASVRARARSIWWLTLLLGPPGAAALLLVGGVLADQALVLPAWLRLVLLAIVVLVPVWLLRRALGQRPATSEEELALLVERRYPDLNNLLINTLQLTRLSPPGGRHLVGALSGEANQAVVRVEPARAVPRRALAVAMTAAILGGLLLGGMALFDRDALGIGLNRVLLPYADNSRTRILDVSPGDCDVLRHEDLVVTARLGGVVPSSAQLVCDFEDGQSLAMSMSPASEALPDRQKATVARLAHGGTYHVVAGDDRSRSFRFRVHRRPAIRRVMHTIQPPPYVRAAPTEQAGGTIQAVAGSTVRLRVHVDQAPRAGAIVLDDGQRIDLAFADAVGTAQILIERRGHYGIELLSEQGFAGEPAEYDIVLLADRPPRVAFTAPRSDGQQEVDMDAVLTVAVRAEDDHAVRMVRLLNVADPAAGREPGGPEDAVLAEWALADADQRRLERTATVAVAELGLREAQPAVLQLLAWDFGPEGRPGISERLTLRLRGPPADPSPGADVAALISLDGLIAMQRTNLDASRALARASQDGDAAPLAARQERIRRDALALSEPAGQADAVRTPVQAHLADLADTLMALAIEQLRDAARGSDPAAALAVAIETEASILRALTIAAATQMTELATASARAIAARLAELIARQTALRDDTAGGAATPEALGRRQRELARRCARLQGAVRAEAEAGAGGNVELSQRYGQVAEAFEQRGVRANMLVAAERLGGGTDAVDLQNQVLTDLAEIQGMLRASMLAEGRAEAERAVDAMAEARERLDRLSEVQRAITEVAEQLRKTADLTDGRATDAEDLAELVEAREQVAEAIEQLVQDMHLLPAMTASNDILEEMSEIYEDVRQAEGSADDPVSEVAVDRDEGLLAMIREMQEKMEERMADMEMWLSDRPDAIKWNQESFDRDELGEIPLGDLPDALEDIVGDLVEQSEQLSEEAEDMASNAAIPDAPMGWDILDGPMPSWAAKGKSGNERPNSNEQVGRSGSGRQGKSSGEMVGDTMKALEGAEVETRRTQDGFQAGQIKEEDPGAMDVKATGGGKMAGTTETEGMTGQAPPRNELAYRHLRGQQARMQRNVETVYTKARMLRLPTGRLDRALLELDTAARRLEADDLRGFARSQQQVVRALRQTAAGLAGRPVVLGPAAADAPDALEAGATAEPVPPEYEQAVARYMRRIAGAGP